MKWILALAFGILVGRYFLSIDPNSAPTYGSTGLPKNCRAIIQANIDGMRSGQFSAIDAMGSIEQNCGAHAHGWEER